MVYPPRTDSVDRVVPIPSLPPLSYQLQKQTRLNKQAKTQRKKADGAIQSASGRHPNWVPTAASGGLGALLPFLSSTYSVSLTAVSIPTPTPSPQ